MARVPFTLTSGTPEEVLGRAGGTGGARTPSLWIAESTQRHRCLWPQRQGELPFLALIPRNKAGRVGISHAEGEAKGEMRLSINIQDFCYKLPQWQNW